MIVNNVTAPSVVHILAMEDMNYSEGASIKEFDVICIESCVLRCSWIRRGGEGEGAICLDVPPYHLSLALYLSLTSNNKACQQEVIDQFRLSLHKRTHTDRETLFHMK